MPHVSAATAEESISYSAGEAYYEAYYVPPGHIPIQHAGARIVEFSQTEQLGEAVRVLMANVQRSRTPQGLTSRA
jgi:hypothetical protein